MSDTHPPCEGCPAAALGLDCPATGARRPAHRPFCAQKGDPGMAAAIVRMAREDAGLAPRAAPPPAPAPAPGTPCGCDGKPLPSLARRAANLAAAVARHVADGLERADGEVQLARLAACAACDRLRDDRRCAECGCPVEAKARWASERCPLGRWGEGAAP